MKKFVTSVVLASALFSSAAFAESDGAFVGANVAYGTLKLTGDVEGALENTRKAFRVGIVGGYKQFFTSNFGARYYLNVDSGSKYATGNKGDGNGQVRRTGIGVNADALYNFIDNGDTAFGAFGGLSLEYAMNKYKEKGSEDGDSKANGLDVGINVGLRAVFADVHGVELYSRIGVVGPKFSDTGDYSVKAKTPANIGLRYTFTF